MSHTYRIVVGVDGSDGGLRALRWAIREAAARRATVHAVTVWSWDPTDRAEIGYAENLRAAAEQTLSTAIAQALNDNPHVTVTSQVVTDRPAHGLVTAAREGDLLVLGSHGHGRVFHAVLGSVAEECVRAAVCPVVVIPVPHEVNAHEPSGLSAAASS